MKKDNENHVEEEQGNIFNPDRLRLTQDFSEIAGVKKAIITIPVRKPNRQEFIRVCSDENYRLETAIIEMKEDRTTYLVDKSLWNEMPGEIVPKVLFTTLNRQGTLTIWPIRLPDSDGRLDQWNRSAIEAAKLAQTRWIRVAANMDLGAYEVVEATGDLPEPEWPDLTLEKILAIAFKNHFIHDLDHPIIKELRGET